MGGELKLPREVVLPYAQRICDELKRGLAVCEIAGSLRREKAEVGDIEIVGCYAPANNLFGDGDDIDTFALGSHLVGLIEDGVLAWDTRPNHKMNGERAKRFMVPALGNFQCDLFLGTRENYGAVKAIRTGNGDFSKRLMTARKYGGMMPDGMQQSGGYLWRNGEMIPVPTEREYFKALGATWVEPRERSF